MDIEWNRIVPVVLIVAVIAAAVGFLAWNLVPQDSWQKAVKLVYDKPKVVFVLFDLSNSTRSMRETYAADFEKILGSLKGGDRLIVDRITENPLTQSTFPVDTEFTKYGIFDQRGSPIYNSVNQKELNDEKKSVQATVDKVLSAAVNAQATPIMDAVHLAERGFNTYPDGESVLAIFSDMVEVSDSYDFDTQALAPYNIESIIEKKKAVGELPELNGVKVYVIGAGAGVENSDIDSQRWQNIQNFWLSYFAATGADLSKDRYGAALLEF